ncbi:MAG: glycosyl hydrolase family 28 protein [Chitinophagaceae bacterium]
MKRILIGVSMMISLHMQAQKKDFIITAYGAKSDGVSNNQAAIQKAIDDASAAGGGRVVVPRGRFYTAPLHFKSNVELYIHEEAVLLASTNRADYGPSLRASAFLIADNAKNIAITGKGLIDGQSDLLIKDIYEKLRAGTLEDPEWKEYNAWHQRRPSERNRPKIITFINCDAVTIKNVHIQNGADWVQEYRACTNLIMDSVHVFSNTFINNDGIDVVDCKKVRITNCNINVADDGICLKSSDRKSRCEDVYVANCRVRSSASALKLGTASHGGFKNIGIKNIEIYDTYRSAIAIEAVDGGIVDNVDIRNVNAVNTGNAIFIRLGHRNKDSVISQLKNVYIGNVKVQVPEGKPDIGYPMDGPELPYAASYTKPSTSTTDPPMYDLAIDSNVVLPPHNVFPSSITGIPGHPVENVTLENVEIVFAGNANKSNAYFATDTLTKVPEAIEGYPEFSAFGELPAWGVYMRHANGVTFKKVTLKYVKPDFRAAILTDDVKGLKLDAVRVAAYAELPVILLNNSPKPVFTNLLLPVDAKRAIKTQ